MFEEIDYIREGKNDERFASLYAFYPVKGRAVMDDKDVHRNFVHHKKENLIKGPKIYWKYTRKRVLTVEWIDGIKLTGEKSLAMVHLDRKELIDQGVYCSLRQFLEVGFFHADPHPGNLVATTNDFLSLGFIPEGVDIQLVSDALHTSFGDGSRQSRDFQVWTTELVYFLL